MNRPPHTASLALAASLALGVLALAPAPALGAGDADVRLVGRGDRRTALDEMSYKPFDAGLLGRLDGWIGGTVNPAAMKDKPVLIVTWAGWYRTSHLGLTEAQRLAAMPENKDLVVILAHHTNDFAKAKETLDAQKIKLPAAHDTSGDFFKALKVDGAGPNFYVVDRAGNLRFADVERGTLPVAVKIVVAESVEDAAKAPDRAKEAKKTADSEKAGTPMAGPDVKARPEAEAYAKAPWPKPSRGVEHAKNVQGKPLPAALGKETWLTEKQDLAGKVVVLDFWATWCGPCIMASPILDDVQAKHKGKAVVLGISGQNDKQDTIKSFLKKKKTEYSQAFDAKQTVYKSLAIKAIPHVVVISSDGVVRWQGNPHDPEFPGIVDAVVAADPWVALSSKASKGKKGA